MQTGLDPLVSRSFISCGFSRSEIHKLPRYDYKCKKCNRNFEVTHGINDTVESCDECGGEVRRVFHPVGIVFKGSGFYATDSKKPDNKPGKPYSEAEKEFEKATSGSEGNGKKDKPAADKKPADTTKTEKAAS
jgi:putative FmdB family regulatory protein